MTVELYFLGAGKPDSGNKPAALKNVTNNTKAMDWQLHSFDDVIEFENVYFLGGYHVDEVVSEYPNLNFLISPEWEKSTPLDTLLHAPFSGDRVLITYADTLFRKDFINKVVKQKKDVTVVVDYKWKKRFESRTDEDINKAETITLNEVEVEFTGLVYLNKKAINLVNKRKHAENPIGTNIIALIEYLEKECNVEYLDVDGEWAEFNSPSDITNFILGTKADTLSRLEHIVKNSTIGVQYSFTTKEWVQDRAKVIDNIQSKFPHTKLVVRSSSKAEDNWRSSNAGGFKSILNVNSNSQFEIDDAIKAVVDSYGETKDKSDQVLVQEFLQDVAMAGVVFTCTLESGAPYYRFNFDDTTQSTESVTAGTHTDLRTVLINKAKPNAVNNIAPELNGVLAAVKELESLLGFDKLDIEFAVDQNDNVHIFQVRPLVVNHDHYDIDNKRINESLASNVRRYKEFQTPLPHVHGEMTVFANMPDWNPAEIISTRPKPLAFSLYQELITNSVWAKQRAEFGYQDVRPYPLIVAFSGQPYVDSRASFNSFIPRGFEPSAAKRIVDAYINILKDNPHYHDKVEFDIAFTIWTPEFKEEATTRLMPYGVTQADIQLLESGLKQVTRNALTRLEKDISSIAELSHRRESLINSELAIIDKVYGLLGDCKSYGTLAFSHAARAGFVATTLMKSLISNGKLSEKRCMQFLNSFDTVAGDFEKAKAKFANSEISLENLVESYGHLRPGTYEIATEAYWEVPEQYLVPKYSNVKHTAAVMKFKNKELVAIEELLKELGSELTCKQFVDYLVSATQERERVKFEFTKSLSKALDYITLWANDNNITRQDASFLTFSDIRQAKLNGLNLNALTANIDDRKESYQITKVIELPAVITEESQFYSFERHSSLPNFIGVDSVTADVVSIKENVSDFKGKIIMIPQADPGYDWLFGHDIAGLITQYGGANSHMAIRSAEVGLPAAIGVGEKLYDSLLEANQLELDCLGQTLRVIA